MSAHPGSDTAVATVAATPALPPIPDRRVAVSVRDVSKSFVIPHHRVLTMKERLLHPRRGQADRLDVLRGIDFDIREGEFFGIVGRNGSGKSTLLKCMAGIYAPDAGDIGIRGKLATFIELGVGFNPDLNARDNAILNATLLGLSSREARRRFDEIIAFAELEEFADLQLRNFSSGMHVRLAFSVAIHVDAEVLLIDEVLAVGDMAFQQKCFETFDRFRAEGRTVVFVTHDMALVERFCTRALMLEAGQIAAFGDPPRVAVEYMRLNYDRLQEGHASGADESSIIGDGTVEFLKGWASNAADEHVTRVGQDEWATVAVRMRFNEPMTRPIVGVTLKNHRNEAVFSTSTALDRVDTGEIEAGEERVLRVRFRNHLEDGRYLVTPSVAYEDGVKIASLHNDFFSFLVTGRRNAGGNVNLPHETVVDEG